jgi:hypothetical protein
MESSNIIMSVTAADPLSVILKRSIKHGPKDPSYTPFGFIQDILTRKRGNKNGIVKNRERESLARLAVLKLFRPKKSVNKLPKIKISPENPLKNPSSPNNDLPFFEVAILMISVTSRDASIGFKKELLSKKMLRGEY